MGVEQALWARGDEWMRRARVVDARARTRSDVLPDNGEGHARYPRFVARAKGAHIWDVDGNRYLDLMLGYGPVVLGHAHPEVTRVAVAELTKGHCVAPLWSPRQVELTELLTAVVPGAEAALIVKTGSDATSAAVRLARIATSRDRVVRWGYNGWHDWSAERAAGIPSAVRDLTTPFNPDDLDALREILDAGPTEVACVVMMPFEERTTSSDRLATIREMCHARGALFVLDEMRSGFRVRLGGAQELLDVRADLVALGKAMGNGYAISAVCGPRTLLDGLKSTKISSTYFANPVDMAAAIATISILRDSDALERIWRLGTLLQDGLRDLVGKQSIPAEVLGYPCLPMLRFKHDNLAKRARVTDTFFGETVRRGLLVHPDHQWFLSAAHTEGDIEWALRVCDDALRVTEAASARLA